MLRCDGRQRWKSRSNKDRRHHHLPLRHHLPPRGTAGSLGGGGYLTAGAEANHQSLHGRYVGTPSQKRRRHRWWLGSRDDDRLPRITGPCDRLTLLAIKKLTLTAALTQGRPLRHRLSFNMLWMDGPPSLHACNSHTCNKFHYTMMKNKLYHCKDGDMKIKQI